MAFTIAMYVILVPALVFVIAAFGLCVAAIINEVLE
jgi:hypothetical protein